MQYIGKFATITAFTAALAVSSIAMAQATRSGNTSGSANTYGSNTYGSNTYGNTTGTSGTSNSSNTSSSMGSTASNNTGPTSNTTASNTDWNSQDKYWRSHYYSRPYYSTSKKYSMYEPAYRYGVDLYKDSGGKPYSQLSQSQLSSGWNTARGSSNLKWSDAQKATRDAYNHLYDENNSSRAASNADTRNRNIGQD